MGVVFNKMMGSSQAQTFKYDETTGLSGDEKKIISNTFGLLRPELGKHGERLFLIYFTMFPDNKRYFRDFKDLSMDDLKGNPKLIAHGTNVLSSFNSFVMNLSNPPVLVALLEKTGKNHSRRNIDGQAFKDLKLAILEFLKETLKDSYTKQVDEAWNKGLDVILGVVQQSTENQPEECE